MMYGEEFQLIFSCQFEFSQFPFDENECRMVYGDETFGIESGTVHQKELCSVPTACWVDFEKNWNYF